MHRHDRFILILQIFGLFTLNISGFPFGNPYSCISQRVSGHFKIEVVKKSLVDLLQRMRTIGSALVIAAYFITLYLDVVIGVIIHLTAMSISVPYFIKSKAWDVVIMMSFLMTIGTGKLITAVTPWVSEVSLWIYPGLSSEWDKIFSIVLMP